MLRSAPALLTILAIASAAPAQLSAAQSPTRLDGLTVRAMYEGAYKPDMVVANFSHMERLAPSVSVSRGTAPAGILPQAARRITTLRFALGARSYDLNDYLALNRVAGLIVLKDGKIAYEDYELGARPDTLWASFSMAKSITSTLVAVALRDGYIKSLDDPVTRYLPALRGSAYEGVSVRHLLQMSSGVAWNEVHADPTSDRRRLLEAQIAGQPGAELRYMATLRRAAPPGTRWNYNTGETYLVGDVVRAAVGRPLAAYLSEKIWSKLGMERDAGWWLQTDGVETGGGGFSATLRDYARFGLFVLDGGRIEGQQIVPGSWFAEATIPARSTGQPRDLAYGYQWWLYPHMADPIHSGAFMASGIFGQTMYLNPRERLVIVVLSARSKPVTTTVIPDSSFFAAVARALR
ncbi:serine hydrolase domain-containing protein [Sphingomonas oleivorans]|nr:serine hydrolase [Sphingomonas oleivorans]